MQPHLHRHGKGGVMDPSSVREFAQQTVRVAAGADTFGARKAVSANEKVVVGVMGLGGRGTDLALRFAARSDVNLAYLCDVDTRRMARAKEGVGKEGRGSHGARWERNRPRPEVRGAKRCKPGLSVRC